VAAPPGSDAWGQVRFSMEVSWVSFYSIKVQYSMYNLVDFNAVILGGQGLLRSV
jgi:hypothetical protein